MAVDWYATRMQSLKRLKMRLFNRIRVQLLRSPPHNRNSVTDLGSHPVANAAKSERLERYNWQLLLLALRN